MKVVFVCGGTAGHINPALAVADKFKEKVQGLQILFAGTPNGMEARLVRDAGYDFVPISVMGFGRKLTPGGIIRNIKAVKCLISASSQAKKIILEFEPDIIMGTGGYVSYPVVEQGIKLGVKTAIHEQNAFPGEANKKLAKKADRVFIAAKEAEKYFSPRFPCVLAGNPVRDNIIYKSKAQARSELGLDDKPLILSFGGSLGARYVNKIAADIMAWHAGTDSINHIHGYGKNGIAEFPAMLQERGVDLKDNKYIQISEYINNMDTCLAAADLVICRCGGITISELTAAGKPSILIPSPNVTANHQYYNGKVLADSGAAILVQEKDYDKDMLIREIEKLVSTPGELQKMSEKASSLAILNTADIIVDELLGLCKLQKTTKK